MFKSIENTFLYFAYGSNLLKKRIHINNSSAEFLGCGRLDDHQLDFMRYSDNWHGTSATIIPTKNSHVWGAIWRLHNADMKALDRQEGVDVNWYFPKDVDVVISDGSKVVCRTYQQIINPPLRKIGEELPEERRPCITYVDCIVQGAIECKIPDYYIEELKKIPNNGKLAPPAMLEKLAQSDHQLDFKYTENWRSTSATIVPTKNCHVWGAIWRIHNSDMKALDRHEGVDANSYIVKDVNVVISDCSYLVCRTYQQTIVPPLREKDEELPEDRRPCITYLDCIIQGAIECDLPYNYIEELKKIPHNGQLASPEMIEKLSL